MPSYPVKQSGLHEQRLTKISIGGLCLNIYLRKLSRTVNNIGVFKLKTKSKPIKQGDKHLENIMQKILHNLSSFTADSTLEQVDNDMYWEDIVIGENNNKYGSATG
jgi:hypothetical protein